MELAENVSRKILIRIILLGNAKVGKTQIINRWYKNAFSDIHRETVGADFGNLEIEKNNHKVTLQLWDTPNDRFFSAMPPNFFYNAQFIFIVIAADKSKKDNIAEIREWYNYLQENVLLSEQTQIVILQNKTDIDIPNLLTHQELPPFKDRSIYLQNFSAKDHDKSILNMLLCNLMPELNFNQALQDTHPTYKQTQTNISLLAEPQAIMLLNSLRNLLDRGPVNEEKKRYDRWFGGRVLKEIDDTKIKAPEHVCHWIHDTIDVALVDQDKSKKMTLSSLYDEIITTSLNVPFSRSKMTNDFYRSLINFIEFCVNPANHYFMTRENISKLSQDSLSPLNALNTIILILKKGHLPNAIQPYNVTFFGGKKVIVDNNQITIKAPTHIATLLNYLMYDIKPSIIDKICFALDFSITSKFSTCGSREQTTQEFYDNLPTLVATAISDTLPKSQVGSAPPSPYGTL